MKENTVKEILNNIPIWLIICGISLGLFVCGFVWIPIVLLLLATTINKNWFGFLGKLKPTSASIDLMEGTCKVLEKKAVTVPVDKKPVIFSDGKTIHYGVDVLPHIEEVYVLLLHQSKKGKFERFLQRQVSKKQYEGAEVGKDCPVVEGHTPRIIWEVNGVALDIVDQLNEIREKFNTE